jgi:hypothetical protein
MTAAKFAAVGQKEPVDGPLDGVANADAPKLYRSAMRTVRRVHFLL